MMMTLSSCICVPKAHSCVASKFRCHFCKSMPYTFCQATRKIEVQGHVVHCGPVGGTRRTGTSWGRPRCWMCSAAVVLRLHAPGVAGGSNSRGKLQPREKWAHRKREGKRGGGQASLGLHRRPMSGRWAGAGRAVAHPQPPPTTARAWQVPRHTSATADRPGTRVGASAPRPGQSVQAATSPSPVRPAAQCP